MSSFVAHAAVGGAIGGAWDRRWIALGTFAALAPDLDHALLLLGGVEIEPRLTHSIGFAVLLSGVVALGFRAFGGRWRIAAAICLLASLSHVVMDALVGVHANPLFWPLSDAVVTSPVGILPSAGRPDPLNPYFWRNLGIEAGIVLPALLLLRGGRGRAWTGALLVALCVFVWIGWSLDR